VTEGKLVSLQHVDKRACGVDISRRSPKQGSPGTTGCRPPPITVRPLLKGALDAFIRPAVVRALEPAQWELQQGSGVVSLHSKFPGVAGPIYEVFENMAT